MLAPYKAGLQIEVLLRRCPIAVETRGDNVRAVTLRNSADGQDEVIQADYFLDATELGDLLEFANIEHVTGAESQAETGELHALSGPANPLDQQAISWCYALD